MELLVRVYKTEKDFHEQKPFCEIEYLPEEYRGVVNIK